MHMVDTPRVHYLSISKDWFWGLTCASKLNLLHIILRCRLYTAQRGISRWWVNSMIAAIRTAALVKDYRPVRPLHQRLFSLRAVVNRWWLSTITQVEKHKRWLYCCLENPCSLLALELVCDCWNHFLRSFVIANLHKRYRKVFADMMMPKDQDALPTMR